MGVDEIWLEADVEEDVLDEEEVEAEFYCNVSVSALLDKQKMITEVDDEELEEIWLEVVDTPSVGVVEIVVAGVEGETWAGVGAFVTVADPGNGNT